MNPTAIGRVPGNWRVRASVGVAAVLGTAAIAGGMIAGLETGTRWSNDADAAVIPDVVYLEHEMALATIARVNSDIAKEIASDGDFDDRARRASRFGALPSMADATKRGDADDPGSVVDEERGASDANGAGSGNSGVPGGSGTANNIERDRAIAPNETEAVAAKPDRLAPSPDPIPEPEPSPEPEPYDPTRGNGVPQNDKAKAPAKDPTVDARTGGHKEEPAL